MALHDSTVDRTTNGTGNIADLTFEQVRSLTAADYDPWRGGEYDGSQVASVEEVLDLARRVGGGLELDIKGSVTEEGKLAELVGDYGLIEESIFNSGDPRILAAEPGARLIFNRDDWEPAFLIYEIGQVFKVFGPRLDEYSPESIAAAHDACAIVMPHAYDAGPDQEVPSSSLPARSAPTEPKPTNLPALVVPAASEAVASKLLTRREHVAGAKVCLVNGADGLGFPGKTVHLVKDELSTDLVTGLDGCVGVPTVNWRGASVSFAGDGSVHASTGRILPSTG